jgi:hypothetical protein
MPGPLRAASGTPPPRTTPWAAQSSQLPLAGCGAAANTPVLLGQFLDANANVNEAEFFIKFSNELGAAESVATRHNSVRARDVPDKLPDKLPADLLRAPAVLVRRDGHEPPLEPLYNGPYQVLAHSRDWFCIQVGDRTDSISTSHLKPCLDLSAPPAEPRCRGRPPGPPKAVTFRWPAVEPLPTHLAVLAVPATPSSPSPVLAAARPPTSPGLGPGTVFSPQRQGFFVRRAPTRRRGPLHRLGGRNATGGHRSG